MSQEQHVYPLSNDSTPRSVNASTDVRAIQLHAPHMDEIKTAERRELGWRLSCPIHWDALCNEIDLRIWLHFAWYAVGVRHQVDREVSSLFPNENCVLSEDLVAELDDGEVATTLHNVRRWHKAAQGEYEDFFRRLTSMRVVGPKTYKKHYSRQAQSAEGVAHASSSRRASVLSPHVTTHVQMCLFWAALDDFVWHQMAFHER